jgi:hypothetical protein
MVTLRQAPPRDEDEGIGLGAADIATLQEIERRVLWLSTLMVHHANNVRENPDKPTKVGGHQASSASVITILTALTSIFCRLAIEHPSNRMPLPRSTPASTCWAASTAST